MVWKTATAVETSLRKTFSAAIFSSCVWCGVVWCAMPNVFLAKQDLLASKYLETAQQNLYLFTYFHFVFFN